MVARVDENSGAGLLGSWLKSARESRGESLEDVSRVTRIGKNYLEAIEQGMLHKLPSDAYVKGFIRLYAKHLGLSGDEAIARLNGDTVTENGTQTEAAPRTATAVAGKQGNGGYRRWVVSVTLLLFLIIISRFPLKNKPTPQPEAPPVALPVQQSATGNAVLSTYSTSSAVQNDSIPAPPVAEPPAPSSEAARQDGVILSLRAVQTGKLHITIDGELSQEYDLNVGDLVEWKAEKSFLLDLDNAASVEGELNGRQLKSFGGEGQSAHLVISADGVQQE